MSYRDADVIVAGGGPVGLAAAIEARLAGLSVIVVEPREGPVDKACGEGLMPGALPLLARLGVDPDGMPLAGVSYRDGARRVDHLFETGPGRGVRRTALHSALAARAVEAGVTVLERRVESVEQDATGVSTADLRGSWLLGCDGLHSTVRSAAGMARGAPERLRRYGIRRHAEMEPWGDLVEVYWTPRAEVYITPVAPRLVGVAVLGPAGTDFDAAIASVPELARRLDGVTWATARRGAGPFRQRARRVRDGRVLLIGDASGYVDAITGEGLRLGFDHARAAVASLVGDVDYEREWRRVSRDFRSLTSGLVTAASGPLRAGIVPLAARAPRLFGAIVERLAR
ncbi:flavin-dependent dehydrogenase [Microbacteriaceae bacterium SG_E_30_P1]|uniref:Flavin-dependent dehydrogenase n=1 Tax=Antiquaquibacter oligotrophicus TaxID=2880260 RepID=A0ABT6KR58_9MICO|nr:NAD(P)/FAD-dependent oxidoreductase [Antiquaquibacter oligotrophicus]MDH6182306.1 flavin-dependent dehydrogenase [Antiquaquibacter oligotrophicus]UDF12039.1 NAD(P)/FAD-dependent oxidoreductase [Antiquaquibacter oligotrophicus]